MPKGKVPIPKQPPHAALLDVLVLVQPALPPLDVAPRVRLVDALVRAGRHEGAHAHPGVRPGAVDVDNVLHHGVVEEEAVDGPVAALDEEVLEPAQVQPPDARLAAVPRAEELDVGVGVVGEEVYHLGFCCC